MYVAKGKLQSAADAGALAGASQLRSSGIGAANPNDLIQTAARNEAIKFANVSGNMAAGKTVVIANNNTNTLTDDNDIAVGNWNGTAFRPYSTPVNAIEVRTRRTSGSPGGQVDVFLGRVLRALPGGGADWGKMSAAAVAIASLPVRANNYISICQASCTGVSSDPSNPTVISPPREYVRDPNAPGINSFAWTSLLNSVSSASGISPLICSDQPNQDVCGKKIWTTQGTVSDLFKDMEGTFNDPNYDKENKEFSGGNVSAWWIIVPVTVLSQCNPGNQPTPSDIWGYALVRVISVCDTGGGNACRPYSSHPCTYPHEIVIDRIACVDCPNARKCSGNKDSSGEINKVLQL